MALHAIPQSNGNRREDFEAAYVALRAAHDAVENAKRLFMGDVATGRNYQHLGHEGLGLCSDDREHGGKMFHTAQRALGSLMSDIVDTLERN